MFNVFVVKLTIPAIVCALLLVSGIRAQQPVTLHSALEQLKRNAPMLAADSAAIVVSQQKLAATRYSWWPNLRANMQVALGTNNNLPGGFFSNGLVPSNSRVREQGRSNTVFTDLGVASFDWEIYNFGAYEGRNRVAESDLEVQQLNYNQAKYQLQQTCINVYLSMILLKEMMGLQDQNIERNAEIKKIISALAVSGIKAGVDTSIAEAELSKSRLLKLEMVKEYRQLQFQLGYLTGLPGNLLEIDSLLEERVIARYTDLLTMQDGQETHPLLLYYKALRQNSYERENLIKKEYLPKVLLQASVWGRGSSVSAKDEFGPLYTGVGIERMNYLMGVGITYNLFDNKRKQLQTNVQKAITQHAEKKLEEQKAWLTNSLHQNQVDLTTAYDRIQEIPRQLEAAAAAYRQKMALYKNGLTNIIELNLALSILYRAETDYAQAKFSFSRAIFEKAMLENQLTEFLQTLN